MSFMKDIANNKHVSTYKGAIKYAKIKWKGEK